MALQPSKLSDFRIVAALGSGATARVFEAIHLASGREVAIKMLDPREEEAAGELRERFAREAIALSQLSSRHIAHIVGFGFEMGQPFLVLERLHGETIDARIKREGPIPPALLGPWIAQLLVGVRDCHAHNVIHRDIKPANIFLQSTAGEPVVKLIDFGVARLSSLGGGAASLTSTQHLLGSVGYMAPEQFESGKAVGPLTDLYAMGVVVFRCITGKLPFSGGSLDRVIQAKLHQEPALISSVPGAPVFGALDWFAAKAMARDPAGRFQTAREMLDAWHDIMPLLGTVPTRPQTAPVPLAEVPIAQAPPTPVTHPTPPSMAPASLTAETSVAEVQSSELLRGEDEEAPVGQAQPFSMPIESDAASTSENSALQGQLDALDDEDGEAPEDAPHTRLEMPDLPLPDASPLSEVFGLYSTTSPQFERGPASVPRTARRGPMIQAPRKRLMDDETTKTYPHLRALVETELEISRGERQGRPQEPEGDDDERTAAEEPELALEDPRWSGPAPRSAVDSEGPPTTQHTGPPLLDPKNPPPDDES